MFLDLIKSSLIKSGTTLNAFATTCSESDIKALLIVSSPEILLSTILALIVCKGFAINTLSNVFAILSLFATICNVLTIFLPVLISVPPVNVILKNSGKSATGVVNLNLPKESVVTLSIKSPFIAWTKPVEPLI